MEFDEGRTRIQGAIARNHGAVARIQEANCFRSWSKANALREFIHIYVKMKKSILLLTISLLLLVSFAACSAKDSEAWGKVRGVVTENDVPLSGVKVTSGKNVTYTDGDGFYSIEVGEGGEVVTFEKEGCLTLSKTFSANSFYRDEIEFNATLFYSSRVFGKVTKNGQAVSGADVTLGARTVKTDDKGEYFFEKVLCTDAVVIVEYNGQGKQKPVYYSSLKDGEEELNFELEGV